MPSRSAVALVLLAGLAVVAQAGVIAVGSLQSCVNDGTTAATRLECQNKIVVTINIEDSSLYQTEELSFSVSCVNSTTGSCPCGCDYSKDPGCTCRNLQQDIRVSLQKTPVYASYPLTAHRAPFNGAPFEEAREVGKCEAGEYAQFPSCGWAKDPNTQADIPFSQGFCCTCSSYGATDLKRRSIQCGGFLGWGNTESAHCLHFSPDWWHAGFRIGEFALKFRINLNVTTVTPAAASNSTSSGTSSGSGSPPGAPAASPPPPGSSSGGGGGSSTQILSLTPSQPSQRDASKRVSARLVGDLVGYQQEAQLDGKWLMVPFGAGVSQIAYQEYLPYRRGEWMIVDANQVSLDGTECNKIGTSYAAFRNAQGPNACRSPQNSCLANQLRDLYITDQGRINRGETPLYLIGRYGGGPQNGEQVDYNPENAQLSLNLPVPGMRTSIVSLSVAADNVTFVVNNSPANITRAQVCTYGGTQCGGFEAMTTQGYLYVDVRNTGYLAASYIVSVTECTTGVMPVVAQHASIDAQSAATLIFQLRMETDQGTNSSCTVTVTDSLGGVASTQGFSFYTNATHYDKPPDESDLDTQNPPPGGPTTDWCQLVCPNILDLKCSALKGCFGRLSKGIAAIVGPLTALLALVFAYRTGYLQILFRALSAVLFTSRPAAASQDSKGSGKGSGKGSKSKRRQARPTSEEEEEEEEEGNGGGQRGSASQRAAQPTKGQWPPSAEAPPSDAIAAVRLASESGGPGPSSDGGSKWPDSWRLPRQGSGSFKRARASLAAAVQQAHAVLASLQNLVTNPLAVPETEQAHQPLPVRVAMPPACPATQPAAAGSPVPAAGWAALPQTSPALLYGSPSPAAAPLLAPAPAVAATPLSAALPLLAQSPLPAVMPAAALSPVSMAPAGLPMPQPTAGAVAAPTAAPAQMPAAAQLAGAGSAVAGLTPPGWRSLEVAASSSVAPPASPGQPYSSLAQPLPSTMVPAAASPSVPATTLAPPLPASGGGAASTRAALEAQLRQMQLQRQQLRERLQQQQQQGAAAGVSGSGPAVPRPVPQPQ